MTKIDNFEENCEILEGICEEYGLKLHRGHYTTAVATYKGIYGPFLWINDEDLSDSNWDSIREKICYFCLEDNFS
jgi:hypothetical protein